MSDTALVVLLCLAVGALCLALLVEIRDNRLLQADLASETRWADQYHRDTLAAWRESNAELADQRKAHNREWTLLSQGIMERANRDEARLITEIGDLHEQLNRMRAKVNRLEALNEIALHLLTQYGDDNERLQIANRQLWAEVLDNADSRTIEEGGKA